MFLFSLMQLEYLEKEKERQTNQALQSPFSGPLMKKKNGFGQIFLWHKS